MPRLNNNEVLIDPDLVPRPVVGHGVNFVTGTAGLEVKAHYHRKAQLIFVKRGVVKCEIQQGLWIVPPQCAIWVPGGTRHSAQGIGTISIFTLFVEPRSAPTMLNTCCAVSVSSLLNELILRCAEFHALYPVRGRESRLVAVLLDELAAAPLERLYLPMPSETRLRKIADILAANPADRATVRQWASRIGTSERTLSRLVQHETGMSFGHWRQQFHVILALQWLSQGTSVQSVASELGYESASSFVFMFRKVMGSSPARYMANKLKQTNEPITK